jgi:hypothetical protein
MSDTEFTPSGNSQISWNGFRLFGDEMSIMEVYRLIRCAERLAELEATEVRRAAAEAPNEDQS